MPMEQNPNQMTPAEHLRHAAPAQSHQGRRAFIRAADFLDLAEGEGYSFEDQPEREGSA